MKTRGFEIAKGWEDMDIELPRRATTGAAGYDIAAAKDVTVPVFHPGDKPISIPTGLKAYCRPDECYLVLNRSSGPSRGIILANGVGLIDHDYYGNSDNDGHFMVLVFNSLDHDLHIKKGDRIAQVVFQKFLTVDHDVALGERRGGIGSTNYNYATPEIIYDVDDVLWPLVDRVFARLNIPLEKETDFDFQSNPALTANEKQAILTGFSDPHTFDDMNFYPQLSEILQVEELGARVYINSNSYSADIIERKRAQIQAQLPNFPSERLTLNLITDHANKKQIRANTFIFVDDSPYNIALSNALINILPEKNWNTSEVSRKYMADSGGIFIEPTRKNLEHIIQNPRQKYIIYSKNLHETTKIIYQLVKLNQEQNHV